MPNIVLSSLAYGLHRGPGQYVLLLGSGVSRSAGIPTGWGITVDLIKHLPECPIGAEEKELVAWYEEQFGRAPSYADLMAQLAPAQVERRNLLRPYFEPSDEEREQGVKAPTEVHRCIAKLVAIGSIRIILTTNFDRLLEQALRDEGIEPDIIFHESLIDGVMPYVHSKCLIIKLHGDYLDTRLKNTEEELAEYPEILRSYLGRVFDDHGLIICGWSADYDVALVNAILATPNRRFSTYWLQRGSLGESAKHVIAERRAEVVPIENADEAFRKIRELILGYQDLDRPQPIDAGAFAELTKRYIARNEYRILLHDLALDELRLTEEHVRSQRFNSQQSASNEDFFREYKSRAASYEASTERLMVLAAAIAYHGSLDQAKIIGKLLERLAAEPLKAGYTVWQNMSLYPALLVLYSAGIGAVAAHRYESLIPILLEPEIRGGLQAEKGKLVLAINTLRVFDVDQANMLRRDSFDQTNKWYTPADDHLYEALKGPLMHIVKDEATIDEAFEGFHFALQLAYRKFKSEGNSWGQWAPLGRFNKIRYHLGEVWPSTPQGKTETDLRNTESGLQFLKDLVNGDLTRFDELVQEVKNVLQKTQNIL